MERDRTPLVKGGQGRSARSVVESADAIVLVGLTFVAVSLVASLCTDSPVVLGLAILGICVGAWIAMGVSS